MTSHDVPDSTDWLSTPLSGLTAVEASLRCQVCKDFYRTPMLTSCSHTFCSICIRRALSGDGKCPLCRAPEQEMKLRSNWAMEETIEAFTKSRAQILQVATAAKEAHGRRSPKRSREEVQGEGEPGTKRTRTSARLSKRAEDTTAPNYHDQPEQDVFVVPDSEDEKDGAYEPELDDGLVACPVCSSRMKEWQVFKHLESCPGPVPKPKAGQSSSGGGGTQPRLNPQMRTANNLERLPSLAYGMMKDNALRKKMQDLGLQTWGSRQNLELRHKEWITLWNANCDAAAPKKRSELLHELDVWERTQGGMASSRSKLTANGTAVKDKDFDGVGWSKTHDDSFKDLIASARKSREYTQKKAAKMKEEEEKGAETDRDDSARWNQESGDQPQALVSAANHCGKSNDSDVRLDEAHAVDSNQIPEKDKPEPSFKNVVAHSNPVPRRSQEPFTLSQGGHPSRQADIESTTRYMQQVQGSSNTAVD